MSRDVFYAWQSDTDERVNRYLIRDALRLALNSLHRDTAVTESPRLRLDHDTKDVPGTPDIFTTILSKIESCAIFVADVTPVAAVNKEKAKPVANPNVMIELGYALARVSDKRILLVMNDAMGRPDDLPFDLARRRWPVTYTADSTTNLKAAAKTLGDSLRLPLQLIVESGSIANPEEVARQKWEPVRKVTVIQIAKTFATVLHALEFPFRQVFESSHGSPFENAMRYLESIQKEIANLRKTIDTNGVALQPDLLPDALLLLSNSEEVFRRLRFFVQVLNPAQAGEEFIGTPPFEQIANMIAAVGTMRAAYPDVFAERTVVGRGVLPFDELKEIWEKVATISGRLFWSPETYICRGRIPVFMDTHHVRRLSADNPPPPTIRVCNLD
jgi:hypothetical protein